MSSEKMNEYMNILNIDKDRIVFLYCMKAKNKTEALEDEIGNKDYVNSLNNNHKEYNHYAKILQDEDQNYYSVIMRVKA